MKLSLNSQQKSDLVLIDTLQYNLELILERWAQSKTMRNYGDSIEAFKTANAWAVKGIEVINTNLDDAEIAALNRRKAATEIVLLPKDDVERLKKQQPELRYWMNREQAYYLAEGVIEGFCRNCKREPAKCEIRKLFIAWEVPGIVGEYEECQYREQEDKHDRTY